VGRLTITLRHPAIGKLHGSNGEIGPEDGTDAFALARLGEADRSVDPIAIGQCERIHPVLGGTSSEELRMRGTVAQRIARCHMEVDEVIGHARASR
jgi:hypothetical protein